MFTFRIRLWLLIIAAALPGLGGLVSAHGQLQAQRDADAYQTAIQLAKQLNSETDRIIEGARGILVAVSELPFVRNLDPEHCSTYLADLMRRYDQFNSISVIDPDGKPVCSGVPVTRNVGFADRAYFREALQNGFSIGHYVVGRLVRQPSLPIAQVIQTEEGQTVAVATIHLDLLWLSEYFKKKALPPGATILVADREGTIINSTESERLLGTKIAPELVARMEEAVDGAFERIGDDGEPRVVAFTSIEERPQGIWLALTMPKEVAAGTAEGTRIRELSLIGALGFLTLLVGGALAELWIRRPVVRAFNSRA